MVARVYHLFAPRVRFAPWTPGTGTGISSDEQSVSGAVHGFAGGNSHDGTYGACGTRTAVHRRGVHRSARHRGHRGDLPAHRTGHRPGAARIGGGRRPGGRDGPPGLRRGPLASHDTGRADRGDHPDQGRLRRTPRGVRAPDQRAERHPVQRECHGAGAGGDDGLGLGDHGGADVPVRGTARRRPRPAAGPPRTGGRGGGGGPVERPAVHGGGEAGPGAAGGLHGGAEGLPGNTAGRLPVGGDSRRGGPRRPGSSPSSRPTGR